MRSRTISFETGRMQTFKWRVIFVIELLKLLIRLRALVLNR